MANICLILVPYNSAVLCKRSLLIPKPGPLRIYGSAASAMTEQRPGAWRIPGSPHPALRAAALPMLIPHPASRCEPAAILIKPGTRGIQRQQSGEGRGENTAQKVSRSPKEKCGTAASPLSETRGSLRPGESDPKGPRGSNAGNPGGPPRPPDPPQPLPPSNKAAPRQRPLPPPAPPGDARGCWAPSASCCQLIKQCYRQAW